MKTLPKKVTRGFFSYEDGFERLELKWSQLAKTHKQLPAEYQLLYAILRGKNPMKCFSEVRNLTKIHCNGASKIHSYSLALTNLKEKVKFKQYEVEDIICKDEYGNMNITNIPLIEKALENLNPIEMWVDLLDNPYRSQEFKKFQDLQKSMNLPC